MIWTHPEKEPLAATFQNPAHFMALVQTHQLEAEQNSPSDCAAFRQQSTRIQPRAVELSGHRAHPDQKNRKDIWIKNASDHQAMFQQHPRCVKAWKRRCGKPSRAESAHFHQRAQLSQQRSSHRAAAALRSSTLVWFQATGLLILHFYARRPSYG